jgi:hypothetical protein
MILDITKLPDIMELSPVSGTVNALYSTDDPTILESDAVITSVTPNRSDSGVNIDISGTVVTLSGPGYRQAFNTEIGYAGPQVDPLAKPPYYEVSSWGSVPEPDDTANFFFLYKFKAPDTMVTTITYTVEGTYSETEQVTSGEPPNEIVTPGDTVTGIPFTLTFTQTVNYDLDSNVAEFKRYI